MEAFEQKYRRMTTQSIPSLIMTLALPTIATMLITSVYNVADTYFVGRLGTSATAAVGVAFPVMCIIQAIGFTFGMGSGNFVSRLLGQKDMEKAEQVAITGFLTAMAIGVILSLIGQIFLHPFMRLLGTTETMQGDATAYVRLILIGMPWMAGSFVLNNLLRYQGNAFFSMIGIGLGGVINIGLDPIFIFRLGMGTSGAAAATILSQFISFCLLLYFCTRGNNIRLRMKHFTPTWTIYEEILKGGLPSFYRQGLASIAAIILNTCAGPYGDAAIAAMSIVSRLMQFALATLLGFGQGFQPVCGFNYGAKRFDRVLEAFWFCVKTAFIFLICVAIMGYIYAPHLIEIFRKEDAEVIAIGTRALRFQCLTFPLSTWIIMNNMLMQTIGKGMKASILALSRQGLFFIPIILVTSHFWGILGIQLSQPIADLGACLLAVPLSQSVIKELKEKNINENNNKNNSLKTKNVI